MFTDKQIHHKENIQKYKILTDITQTYKNSKIIIMGDMNAHIGILGEKVNINGKLLQNFTDQQNLEILNITIAEGKVTWRKEINGKIQQSAIDYILINNNIRPQVDKMIIDEDKNLEIQSDHNPLILHIQTQKNTNNKIQNKNYKPTRKRKKANWNNFRDQINIGINT